MLGEHLDFAPAKGGVIDPRRSLDFLFHDGAITRREYEAGRFYGALYDSRDPRCGALLVSCNQALGRISAFAAGDVRTVAIGHALLNLPSDVKRLREALSHLAMHVEQLEIGLAELLLGQPLERAAEPITA
jgi:hypothetical protein